MKISVLLPLLLALVRGGESIGTGPNWLGGGSSFLLVSSPQDGAVSYARILSPAEQGRGDTMKPEVLVQGGQLQGPTGLAVDALNGTLYVADPVAKLVLAFRIFEQGSFRSGKLAAGEPRAVLAGVTARWVAVDGTGNLYCSDTENGQIWTLPADTALAAAGGSVAPQIVGSSASAAQELYSAGAVSSLKDPEGIAIDSGHVLWANGVVGTTDGSVMRGLRGSDQGAASAVTLVANGKPAYGICASGSRIFYTDGASGVYSLPTNGGETIEISAGLKDGRGCAYDGDGTVFVADEADGKVYSFSGGAAEMTTRPLNYAIDVPGAYDLAVLTSSACKAAMSAVGVFIALLV